MSSNRLLSLLAIAVSLLTGTAGAQQQTARVEAVADVATARAGEPFRVGFHFKMDPAWHIYWQNPGAAGIPTRVKWTLPAGVTAGELQFPVPIKFTQPGDIVGYGYEDEVLLMAQITPPADYAQAELPVVAEVSWLCCADVCIPGKQRLELKVPVGQTAQPANTPLFERWTQRLPATPAADGDEYLSAIETTSQKQGTNARTLRMTATWKRMPQQVDFYPGGHKALEVAEPKVTQAPSQGDAPATTQVEATVRAYPGQKQWPATVDGLLVYETSAGVRRGVVVAMPTPDPPQQAQAGTSTLNENPK
jgi:DsbC/DsbD-like thiol-disulfide interchange protein